MVRIASAAATASLAAAMMATLGAAKITEISEEVNRKLQMGPVGTAEVCPLDYVLYNEGDVITTPAAPPITITNQATTYVDFTIHNVWNPTGNGVDSIFVEYTADTLGSSTCEETQNVGEFDDINIRAYCFCTKPIAVVDIYVVDGVIQDTETVPECCHDGAPPTENTVKYTYVLNCEATCDPEPEPDCDEVVLDFNDLPDYSYVHDEYWYSRGVTITAKADTTDVNLRHTPLPDDSFPFGSAWEDRYGYTESSTSYTLDTWDLGLHTQAGGAARVFDTQNPDRARGNLKCDAGGDFGDRDLGSPNKFCNSATTPGVISNGPGIGAGGQPSATYPNCPTELLGNVIIIQEKAYTCPDDTQKGGWITFDFNPNIVGTIDFVSVKLLDADDGSEPTIRVWKEAENVNSPPSTPSFTSPLVGNNGLWEGMMSFPTGIKRIQFEFPGSGSIAEIVYTPTKCPPDDICSISTMA